MIKLVIFDYDGVIVDSFPTVHKVYLTICGKLGKACPTDFDEFRKLYGLHSGEAMKRLGFSPDERVEGHKIFEKEIVKQKPKLFEGIKETLQALSERYTLVVLSSTHKAEVVQKLKTFSLLDYFTEIIGQESGVPGPLYKSDKIIHLMEKMHVTKAETALIGDRTVDYLEGKKVGLDNIIIVEYGWGYHKEYMHGHKQKIVVKKPADLLRAIESLD